MASASGSRLRADAKPYKPPLVYVPEGRSVRPARVPPYTFPVSDGTSKPEPPQPLPPNTKPWPDVEKEREFIRKTICTALSKVSKEADARFVDSVSAPDPRKMATEVEAMLFKHWGFNDTSKPVGQKYRVLVGAMVLPGDKDLRRDLLLGEITPEELANLSTLELHVKYPCRMFIQGTFFSGKGKTMTASACNIFDQSLGILAVFWYLYHLIK